MKRWMLRLLAGFVGLGLLGLLVAASGIISIKASSGHWPVTAWLLRFGMHRSFATHSLGVKVPRLDDPNLVIKGATHYDFGCRSCHGSPGLPQPRIAQSMTPPAPALAPLIGSWKEKQLFTLVKHGVKFTGMPAWPAQTRDDEVWAVVAFLRQLPDMNETEYRRLARGEPASTPPIQALTPTAEKSQTPSAVLQTCVRCHGTDGLGRGSTAFARLAGQRPEYLKNALRAYASGQRHSGIMGPIATGLDEPVLNELADYYSRQRPSPLAPSLSPADLPSLEIGRRIAHEGIPTQRVPACVDCHAQSGRRVKPAYPLLAGQPADYLVLQLELFKGGRRGGSSYAHLMDEVAPYLTSEQMRAVALYFQSDVGHPTTADAERQGLPP